MTVGAAISFAIASQTFTAFAIGYTAPSNPIRLLVAAVVFGLTWLFDGSIQQGLESRLHVALLSTLMWIQSLKSFDDLCLTRISFRPENADQVVGLNSTTQSQPGTPNKLQKPSTAHTRQRQRSQYVQRFLFGFGTLWNMRGIGTSAQISQIPPWSKSDPSFVPSRNQELKRHARNAILCYLVLDVFANQPPPHPELQVSPKHEKFLSRLTELGAEEAIFRFFTTLGFWLNTFCVIQLIISVINLFSLGLKLYPVDMTPPVWGQLADAYSVRRFWGKTWHQSIRRPLVQVSELFAHTILRLKQGSLLARYFKLTACFYLSGLLHFPADLSLGITADESNVITYFLITALAIMCEDFVQHVFSGLSQGNQKTWSEYVGYVWVCCYMYWMTPSWAYPAARVVQPKDQLVPFSIIREIKELAHN